MNMLRAVLVIVFATLLASCGGGKGTGTSSPPPPGASNDGGANVPATSQVAPAKDFTPSAVASMTLSSPTSNSMVVAWTPPDNSGSSPITGYQVGWTEGGTGRTWVSSASQDRLSSSPLTLTNLVPTSSYRVHVTPFNAVGAGVTKSMTLSTTAPETQAPPTPTGRSLTLPVLGGYYPNWTAAPVRIRDVHPNYNLIYIFHAQPVGGPPGTTGAVYFNLPGDGRSAATNFVADLQYARTVQGRKIILSVGGAGNGMSFPTREKSRTFVNSVVSIYNQLGGFDGLDWNTFEADQSPDTGEMIWISLELKRLFPGFIVTAPPAPWNARDLEFCEAMVRAGAMDFAAPQYYDGPGLDVPSYVVDNINQWVSLLGPEHVAIGFGISDAVNYMTVDEAATTWNQVKAKYPTIRGAFNWQVHTDEAAGWRFANTLGRLTNL